MKLYPRHTEQRAKVKCMPSCECVNVVIQIDSIFQGIKGLRLQQYREEATMGDRDCSAAVPWQVANQSKNM